MSKTPFPVYKYKKGEWESYKRKHDAKVDAEAKLDVDKTFDFSGSAAYAARCAGLSEATVRRWRNWRERRSKRGNKPERGPLHRTVVAMQLARK